MKMIEGWEGMDHSFCPSIYSFIITMADCSEQVSNTDPPSRPDTFDSDKSFQLTVIYVYIDQIGDSLATFKCSMNIMKSVPPKNK